MWRIEWSEVIQVKKAQEIKVVEFVHTAEGVVPVEALSPEQKRALDRWIVKTWVGTLLAGTAEIDFPAGQPAGR
jgi:hypothetical protein